MGRGGGQQRQEAEKERWQPSHSSSKGSGWGSRMQGEAKALAGPGARPLQRAKPGQVPAKLLLSPLWVGNWCGAGGGHLPYRPPGIEKGGTGRKDLLAPVGIWYRCPKFLLIPSKH